MALRVWLRDLLLPALAGEPSVAPLQVFTVDDEVVFGVFIYQSGGILDRMGDLWSQ